jgi:hypothetical protein
MRGLITSLVALVALTGKSVILALANPQGYPRRIKDERMVVAFTPDRTGLSLCGTMPLGTAMFRRVSQDHRQ